MTITEDRDNGLTVRVEAPRGCNFGSEHEIVAHWYSGSDWPGIVRDITNAPVYPCDDKSDCWHDGSCEWWSSDEVTA